MSPQEINLMKLFLLKYTPAFDEEVVGLVPDTTLPLPCDCCVWPALPWSGDNALTGKFLVPVNSCCWGDTDGISGSLGGFRGSGFLQNKQVFAPAEFRQKQFGQDNAPPSSGLAGPWLLGDFDSTGSLGWTGVDRLGGKGGGAISCEKTPTTIQTKKTLMVVI